MTPNEQDNAAKEQTVAVEAVAVKPEQDMAEGGRVAGVGAEKGSDGEAGAPGDAAAFRDSPALQVAKCQQGVLEMMKMGRSIAETARVAGIPRMTIYRWLKSDTAFAAAYNQWLDEIEQHTRSRLYGMVDSATTALEKALAAGDGRLAMQLMKGLGIVRRGEPRLLEEGHIQKRMELDDKKIKTDLDLEERRIDSNEHVERMFEEAFGGKEKPKVVEREDGSRFVQKKTVKHVKGTGWKGFERYKREGMG